MSRFSQHLQKFPAHRSPGNVWVVVLLTVLTMLVGPLTGAAVAAESGVTVHSASAEAGPSVAGSAHSSTINASEQAPDQGESPNEGDNNLEDERDNLVFLEPSTLTESILSDLLSSHPDLLLPLWTEPRGIDKPPRA